MGIVRDLPQQSREPRDDGETEARVKDDGLSLRSADSDVPGTYPDERGQAEPEE